MKPVLLEFGTIVIPSYYTFISLGMLLGIYVFYNYTKKANVLPVYAIDISLIVIISSYIGARLFHILFEMPSYYLNNPLEVFAFWKGGFVIYGGILSPILFVYLYCRKKKIDFLLVTDLLAPSVAIGTALGRVACFMQGCCFGLPTSMPWGVVFPEGTNGGLTPSGISLHPTQIYMVLMNLVIFLVLYFRLKHKRFNGEITYWYFILYPVGRSIVEFFRNDYRGDLFDPYLSTSQFISLLIFLLSTYILLRKYKQLYKRAHS
jgi:phosphatidylglycerol:prolipoprotein diacylglycerol transferase